MTAADDRPQLYLVTPPQIDLDGFPDLLGRTLDAVPVACLRLGLATRDADDVARAADALRAVAHARDVPLVVSRYVSMVERLGLDGVHLEDGARGVREARKELGAEAIVGAFAGASRHDGMNAGEAGADYVALGPVADGGLGEPVADLDLFAWWSEMIELPVVAEGGLIAADGGLGLVTTLAPIADFLCFGEDLWRQPDPVALLREIDGLF